MHLHKNARLTPIIREELVRSVVQDFVPLSAAAAEFNVTSKTAAKWVRRFQKEGCPGLLDRSSRPHRIPRHCTMNYERKIEELCRQLAAAESDEDAATLARETRSLVAPQSRRITGQVQQYATPT